MSLKNKQHTSKLSTSDKARLYLGWSGNSVVNATPLERLDSILINEKKWAEDDLLVLQCIKKEKKIFLNNLPN